MKTMTPNKCNSTMREALTRVKKIAASYINCHDDEIDGVMTEIVAICDSALAAPPRNCDVGTAEEQVERFKEYCQSNMQYYRDMFGTHEGAGGWDCREDCPIGKMVDKNDSFCDHCELLWAQMPYKEGGEK